MTNTPSNKPTLLAVGLFVPGTGFTRVFDSLFAHLSAHYVIHWMGIGYRGAITESEHYTLHPVNINGGDIYGGYGSAVIAEKLDAKAILLLNDFYMLKNYELPWLPLKDKGIRLLAYIPVDGYFNDTDLLKSCLFFDELVFYGNWVLKEVSSAIERYLHQSEDLVESTPKLSYIYHGVDIDVFKKPADTLTASVSRKEIFKFFGAEEAVIILNGNRYNERKDIDTTLQAFKKALPHFSRPAYLCLHMPATDEIKKQKLFEKIAALSLTEFVIYNPLDNGYVTNEQLCRLYQSCQVGINTSLGEGWGLVSFEHAACGAAQLVPDHTTPGELWQNAALLIEKAKPVQLTTNPFLMYIVDEDDLAKKLVLLVNNETYLNKVSDACYQFVHQPVFSWEEISKQWVKVIENRGNR